MRPGEDLVDREGSEREGRGMEREREGGREE